MSTYIVAVDPGNGYTFGVRRYRNGYQSVGFPSVRGRVTGDSLGLGDRFEMQVPYMDWGEFRYAVGDDVFISGAAIERHQGAFRYGNEFWLFLVAHALGQLLPESGGKVDLTVFAPPGIYEQAKAQIEKRLEESQYAIPVLYKGDEEPRVFKICNLTVQVEGLGAAAALALNGKGTPVSSDILTGETLILDSGVNTLDVLKMSHGQFNPETLQSATWEGQGIRAHLLEPILRQVKKKGADFSLMTTDHIDMAVRHGILTGDYIIQSGKTSINIEKLVRRYSERYADYISNNILDGVFNGLRGIRHIIIVGGGAILITEQLSTLYPGKVLDITAYPHVAEVEAMHLNAIGGLRLALARLAA